MKTREPMGLFQTNDRVGLIFPVMNNDGKLQLLPTPCYNDCRGENVALTLMREIPNFVEWGIDPWDGKINLVFC